MRSSPRQGAPCIRLSCGFDDLSLAPQPNHTVVNNLNEPARVTYELHPVLNSVFDNARLVSHSR